MSRAAALRRRAHFGLFWLGVLTVALAWMWFNALLVREFSAESIGRAGWAGVRGTIVVSSCASEVVDQEAPTKWTDCVGYFTAADGSMPPRTVGMPNTGEEMAPGSAVEVRLIDGVAFRQSWFQASMNGAGALFFGLLGGVPIAVVVMLSYGVTARAERSRMRPEARAAVFAVIAVVGEFLLTLLLDRWDLI